MRLHTELSHFNHRRLRPQLPDQFNIGELVEDLKMVRQELAFVEERRVLVRQSASSAPNDAPGFVAWFEALRTHGPGQNDPLFDWLENTATLDEMLWFLTQEVAGEAGFEDLVALTQLQMPVTAKLELARNYWDEMGRGHEGGMHGPMLAHLADALALPKTTPIVWQAKALGNLMVALARHRHYAYQSIGALGVIELTAPARAECVNAGLKRLGVSGDVRRYYAIHATLDVQHSQAWNREVIASLCDQPGVARAIAEGALMRLQAGADCFAAYRAYFSPPAANACR